MMWIAQGSTRTIVAAVATVAGLVPMAAVAQAGPTYDAPETREIVEQFVARDLA